MPAGHIQCRQRDAGAGARRTRPPPVRSDERRPVWRLGRFHDRRFVHLSDHLTAPRFVARVAESSDDAISPSAPRVSIERFDGGARRPSPRRGPIRNGERDPPRSHPWPEGRDDNNRRRESGEEAARRASRLHSLSISQPGMTAGTGLRRLAAIGCGGRITSARSRTFHYGRRLTAGAASVRKRHGAIVDERGRRRGGGHAQRLSWGHHRQRPRERGRGPENGAQNPSARQPDRRSPAAPAESSSRSSVRRVSTGAPLSRRRPPKRHACSVWRLSRCRGRGIGWRDRATRNNREKRRRNDTRPSSTARQVREKAPARALAGSALIGDCGGGPSSRQVPSINPQGLR